MIQRTKFNSDAFYERLFKFGKDCQEVVKILPKNLYNNVYALQLIRSSSSPGANYIEALEALGRKDFIHRLRICRKETRESIHWLRLIKESNTSLKETCNRLTDEGYEITKILTASIMTSEKKFKIEN